MKQLKCSDLIRLEKAFTGPQLESTMNIMLSLKRPLFYFLIPILLVLAFIGFPPPFAPPLRTKPAQEQSVPADEITKDSRG